MDKSGILGSNKGKYSVGIYFKLNISLLVTYCVRSGLEKDRRRQSEFAVYVLSVDWVPSRGGSVVTEVLSRGTDVVTELTFFSKSLSSPRRILNGRAFALRAWLRAWLVTSTLPADFWSGCVVLVLSVTAAVVVVAAVLLVAENLSAFEFDESRGIDVTAHCN